MPRMNKHIIMNTLIILKAGVSTTCVNFIDIDTRTKTCRRFLRSWNVEGCYRLSYLMQSVGYVSMFDTLYRK